MVNKQSIPYQETGYFSKIICDYLDRKPPTTSLYDNFPDIEGFKKQIALRSAWEPNLDRDNLVLALNNQYTNIAISEATQINLELLAQKNTFTITTGHQLNLFTGSLYFLYKIVSVINLCKKLKLEYPDQNFVPIYWMATEDHDFEEIQYFNFKDEKIKWRKDSKGAVGRLDTNGLEIVLQEFSKKIGSSKRANELIQLFKKAYIEHDNLTDATRFLANALFATEGLVIVDGDDTLLKKAFIPYIKEDLLKQTCFSEVNKTIKNFDVKYKVQVNPREINLFYLGKNLRERIVFEEGVFRVNNTEISFSEKGILEELEKHPERFSPNVLMRPLYQEVILPNLCYIGGGGEIAYWLQLKQFFTSVEVPFPILLLRNSVLLATKKQLLKAEKLNISVKDLFLNQQDLVNKKVKELSNLNLELTAQKEMLHNMFSELEELSNKTDKSFLGAVKAQERKQVKGLENLEKRLLKAQKRKLRDKIERIKGIQDQLFPQQSLQERNTNFSEFYLEYGSELIPALLHNLDPLEPNFTILSFLD